MLDGRPGNARGLDFAGMLMTLPPGGPPHLTRIINSFLGRSGSRRRTSGDSVNPGRRVGGSRARSRCQSPHYCSRAATTRPDRRSIDRNVADLVEDRTLRHNTAPGRAGIPALLLATTAFRENLGYHEQQGAPLVTGARPGFRRSSAVLATAATKTPSWPCSIGP